MSGAILGQPHAVLRQRAHAPRARPGAVVPRIQLHDFASLRFRRAASAPRLRAADGRLGSVGQHRQRHRSRSAASARRSSMPSPARSSPPRRAPRWARPPPARSGSTPTSSRPTITGSSGATRKTPMSGALQTLHGAAARRYRPPRSPARRGDQRRPKVLATERPPSCMAAKRRNAPPRRRARPSSRARCPKACRPSRCRVRFSRPASGCSPPSVRTTPSSCPRRARHGGRSRAAASRSTTARSPTSGPCCARAT